MPCIVHETEQERREAARRHAQELTGPLHQEIDRLKTQLAERDAMLCGILDLMDNGPLLASDSKGRPQMVRLNDLLEMVDWKEAGVTVEQVLSWWAEHQEKDRQRRAREAATREARRRIVLSKLSAEERELLGIKE